MKELEKINVFPHKLRYNTGSDLSNINYSLFNYVSLRQIEYFITPSSV